MINKIIECFVTVLYVGKIRFAPGSFGSLVAFPLAYSLMYLILKYEIIFHFAGLSQPELISLNIFIIEIIVILILFILGIYTSSIYVKVTKRKDPKEVVIDEVVGQMLTIILCSFSVIFVQASNLSQNLDNTTINLIFLFLLPFVLFRLFDIFKPWPIIWIDKNISGGFGIMIDDIIAAIFATVMQYVIIFLILDFI